jgi:hypothetical protein
MRVLGALVLSMAAAAVTPFLSTRGTAPATSAQTREWPHEFRGRSLTPVAMTDDDRRFLADFPGATARFTDGEHDIVLRWVETPTRKLHPAEDCYRGWGYELSQSRIHDDADGTRWRCFDARRDGRKREVCEQLRDLEGTHFTDVSSWYWSATLHRTTGPWLVTTVSR